MNGNSINEGLMKNVCSTFIDQREQVEVLWLQDPCQIDGGGLNNVRSETIKRLRKKKGILYLQLVKLKQI
jgi:hypothetical protein